MKITVEHGDVEENEIILRCRTLDEEMLTVLSPSELLYGELVDERTYLYGETRIYRSALTLAELCDRYEDVGYFRISKSSVVNLHKINRLRSLTSGRIEAEIVNKEKVIVSRHYAHLLRQRLGV